MRTESEHLSASVQVYLRDLYDTATQTGEALESYRTMVKDQSDTLAARTAFTSERSDEIPHDFQCHLHSSLSPCRHLRNKLLHHPDVECSLRLLPLSLLSSRHRRGDDTDLQTQEMAIGGLYVSKWKDSRYR